MSTEPTSHAPYERLGRYELLGEIASGGMATVFLGRVTGAKGFLRLVAIKRLHPHLEAEEDFVSMFLDEARLAARIRHPNCVATLDVEDQEGLYIVMEYIEGDRLLGLLRHANKSGDRIPLPVALRIGLDTLAGLHAAHELCDDDGQLFGLVHRDVSPQNILIGVDGVARLTDFGIAKATARLTVTRDGQLKGKIAYMAPEQTKKVEIDRRVDVFAMGIITWEMLTSKKLFAGDSDVEVLNQLLFEPIPRLKDSAPGIPASLDAAVMKALERDPNKRFSTALEFAEALEHASKAFGGPANARAVAAHLQKASGDKLAKDKVRFAAGAHAHSADQSPNTGSSKVQRKPGARSTGDTDGEVLIAGPAKPPPVGKKTLLGAGGGLGVPPPPSASRAPAPPTFNAAGSSGVGVIPDLDEEEEIPTAAFPKDQKKGGGGAANLSPSLGDDDYEEGITTAESVPEPPGGMMMPAAVAPPPMSAAVPGLPVLPAVPAPPFNGPAVPAPPVGRARPGATTEVLPAVNPGQASVILPLVGPAVPSTTGLAAVAPVAVEPRGGSRAGLMVGVGGGLLAAGGLAVFLLVGSGRGRDPSPQVRVVDTPSAAPVRAAGATASEGSSAALAPPAPSAPSAALVEAPSAAPSVEPTAAVEPTVAPAPTAAAVEVAPTPSATGLAVAPPPTPRPSARPVANANSNARVEPGPVAARASARPVASAAAVAPPTPTAAPAPRPTARPSDPFGDDNPYQ